MVVSKDEPPGVEVERLAENRSGTENQRGLMALGDDLFCNQIATLVSEEADQSFFREIVQRVMKVANQRKASGSFAAASLFFFRPSFVLGTSGNTRIEPLWFCDRLLLQVRR